MTLEFVIASYTTTPAIAPSITAVVLFIDFDSPLLEVSSRGVVLTPDAPVLTYFVGSLSTK